MQPRSCQEGERPRESPCLPCAFTPLAGSLKTTKTDKKHGSRQESHPLSDRPEIDWPCRPEYDATISFGLLFEPEDSQYGKFRVASRSRGHDHAVVVEVWVGVGPSRHDPFPLSAPTLREAPALLRKIGVWATQVRNWGNSGVASRSRGHDHEVWALPSDSRMDLGWGDAFAVG